MNPEGNKGTNPKKTQKLRAKSSLHAWSGDYMGAFDTQTSRDLEFNAIRTLLLGYCHNPTAQERAQNLKPFRNRKRMVRALEETKEFLQIRRESIRIHRHRQEFNWIRRKN